MFDTVEDMANCLEALASDLDVSIVRIKSSMTKAGQNPGEIRGKSAWPRVWEGLERFDHIKIWKHKRTQAL